MLEVKKFPHISDHRGFFAPIEHTVSMGWRQANVSHNTNAYTFRGLHFQFGMPQRKAVYVMSGSIVDYAVDVNIHKSTIGEASCFVVKTGEYIEIPNTHAHGFLTLEPNTTILYFVDMSYCPEAEKYVLWQSVKEVKEDVESRIGKHSLTISAKDENAETLQSFIVNNPPMSWEDWLRSKNYSEQEIEVINKQQYPPKKIAK